MLLIIILLVIGLILYGIYRMFFYVDEEAVAAFEKERQEEENKKIEYFSSRPIVISVANHISNDINRRIENADRRAHIQNITVTYNYSVFRDCITAHYSYRSESYKGSLLIDFDHERIEKLNRDEQKLVGCAIFELVKKAIKFKYPKDPSGTDYSVSYSRNMHSVRVGNGKYNEKTHKFDYDHDFGENFEIIYSCSNGFYRSKSKL